MKIMIVGCGFVGSTIANSLEEQFFDVARVDPKYYKDTICDHCDSDGIIVCVDTPTINGKCDDTNLKSVMMEIGSTCHAKGGLMHLPVLIKSTITPDLLEMYPDNVTYSPEFLREKTAKEDFKNQEHMILGGNPKYTTFWKEVFSYLDTEYLETDRQTASIVKYMYNNWLAMKVAFFHEIFQKIGNEYDHDSLVDIISKFENIGPSHMNVPNQHRTLGFDGHCFPKDMVAFMNYSKSDILKSVFSINSILNEFNGEKND